MRVILASASPRRQELLKQLLPVFEVVPADLDEDEHYDPDPWKTAEGLALQKARAVFGLNGDAIVIGGDTVVAVKAGEEYEQLAKPTSTEDAARMLRALSGKEHLVITGLALVKDGRKEVASATTHVYFRSLSNTEIADYVATGEPMDKAGAYAIQGGAKGFVERIEGSWTNVVGLPVELLGEMLQRVG